MKIKKKNVKRMMKTSCKLIYEDPYCLKYRHIIFPDRVICFVFDRKGNLIEMPVD